MSTKKTSSTRAQRGSAADKAHAEQVAQGAELSRFEHHLAEALRIGQSHPLVPASLYNDLADAWNDFLNEMTSRARFYEDERVIALALETYHTQKVEKGGARSEG